MKILIAEDDLTSRMTLQATLQKWGYDPVVTCDGGEAWDALQHTDAPKLAVLDRIMPGMDGLEVLSLVRAKNGPYPPYVILLTARDKKSDVVSGLDAGANDYISKPYDTSELRARLQVGQRMVELHEKLARARRREKNIAARIQKTLLLGNEKEYIPGLDVAAMTIPSEEVDGDFFDTLIHRDNCLDIMVGDVMGKGVTAALLGTAAKSTILRCLSSLVTSAYNHFLPEPAELLNTLRAHMAHELMNLESFITLFYARINTEKQSFEWIDCGHTPTIHYQAADKKCRLLRGNNTPLGFTTREKYDPVTTPLRSDDLLVIYSDGISEATNPEGEMFGHKKIMELITSNASERPSQIIQTIKHAVETFTQKHSFHDDLTCVIAKFEGRDDRATRPDLIKTYDTEAKNLNKIRRELKTFMVDKYIERTTMEEIDTTLLAINEACTNIVNHAFRDNRAGKVEITATADETRLQITLAHAGEAFIHAPTTSVVPRGKNESGYGLHIIGTVMDTVRYSRDARNRNCMHMVKCFN